jgi:hypothetical protein
LGKVCSVQELPFHSSPKPVPLASQAFAVVQETLRSSENVDDAGLGVVSIDQVVPFQRSAKVVVVEPLRDQPTAVQAEVEVQETPEKPAVDAPWGFGAVTVDQVEPFQRSAKS